MKSVMALVVAGGLCLAMASRADAQVSVSIGNPYLGGAGVYGVPYGVGAVPGVTVYSSGYYGLYPGVRPYGFGVGPAVGIYPNYGYRGFYGVAPYPRYGFYGPGGFGYGGFRRRAWGYW
jgi:hypothetical protein